MKDFCGKGRHVSVYVELASNVWPLCFKTCRAPFPRQDIAPLLSPLGAVLVEALVQNKGDTASMEGLSLATRAEFAKSPLMGAIREAGRVKVLDELRKAVAQNEERTFCVELCARGTQSHFL